MKSPHSSQLAGNSAASGNKSLRYANITTGIAAEKCHDLAMFVDDELHIAGNTDLRVKDRGRRAARRMQGGGVDQAQRIG